MDGINPRQRSTDWIKPFSARRAAGFNSSVAQLGCGAVKRSVLASGGIVECLQGHIAKPASGLVANAFNAKSSRPVHKPEIGIGVTNFGALIKSWAPITR